MSVFKKKNNETLKENPVNESEKSDYKDQLNTGLLAMANEDEELLKELEDEKEAYLNNRFSFMKLIKSLDYKDFVKLIILILLIVLLIFIVILKNIKANALQDQMAAQRWATKGASQVSIFLPEGMLSTNLKSDTEGGTSNTNTVEETINNLRFNLTNDLNSMIKKDDSVTVDSQSLDENNEPILEDPLSGPYTYAYSAYGSINIASGDDESHRISAADAIGVGGDFYLFHPVKLLTGSFIYPDDFMKDGVVLDSNTAFRLFGSIDIVGMEVTVNDKPYFVRGVYEVNDDHVTKMAKADGGFVFIDYEALCKDGMAKSINCIEFVSIEPYKGYLFNYLNSSEHTGFENVKLVQNTDRFGFEKLLTYVISEYGSRSMVISPIVYPYWENIARSYEDLCGFLLLIEIFLILLIAIFIISFLNLLFKRLVPKDTFNEKDGF